MRQLSHANIQPNTAIRMVHSQGFFLMDNNIAAEEHSLILDILVLDKLSQTPIHRRVKPWIPPFPDNFLQALVFPFVLELAHYNCKCSHCRTYCF